MKKTGTLALIGLLLAVLALPAGADLIHRYTLNADGSDSVGTAHLTAKGNVSHGTTNGVPGCGGYATFDGDNDAYFADANLGSTFGLFGNYNYQTGTDLRPFTISLWVRSQKTGSVAALAIGTNGSSGTDSSGQPYRHTGFFVRSNSSEGNFAGIYARGAGNNSLVHSKAVTDGNWHHVVGIFGGTYRTIYVDGVTQSNWTSTVNIPITSPEPMRFLTVGAFWRNVNGGEFVDDMLGNIDDVQVYTGTLSAPEIAYLYAHPGKTINPALAGNPTPANGQENVLITDSLSWTKGADPNQTDTITGFYLYSDFKNKTGDPNLYLTATLNANDTDYGNQAGESLGLTYGTTYRWRVDQAINGSAPSDTRTLPGVVWSFKTAYAIPIISGISPANGLYDNGQTAQITTTYISAGASVLGVTWYLNGVALDPAADSNISVAFTDTESTLTILSASPAYEGQYTCVITNSGGNSEPSAAVGIEVKRLVGWYAFENDLTDSAADNDGIAIKTDPNAPMSYVAGKINSALSLNGTDEAVSIVRSIQRGMTIEMWVKTTATGGTGAWYNGKGLVDGETNGTVNDFGTSLRGGNFAFGVGNPDTTIGSTTAINDNQWHYCVATRDADTGVMMLYVDGSLEAQATGPVGTKDAPAELRIGSVLTNINYLAGQLDEVKLYNYPLTDLTIASQYYGITGKSPCVQSLKPQTKYDLNADCVVDMSDFADFASHWMDCGLYPVCE